MLRTGLTVLAMLALAACSSERRPDVPTGAGLPPLGLASTAVWLEQREVRVPQARKAQDIPTSEIRSVVSGGAGPVAQQQAAVARTVSVPDRARPTARSARSVQAFTDACVASIADLGGLADRIRKVNVRDFDMQPRELTTRSGGNLLRGGIDDGPIRMEAEIAAPGDDVRARCGVSTILANARPVAQAKIDTLAASGYRLEKIPAQGRANISWRIVGAPQDTTLNVRTTGLGAGAWITWR